MSFNVSINLGGLGGMVQGGFPGQAPPVDPQLWAWFSAVDRCVTSATLSARTHAANPQIPQKARGSPARALRTDLPVGARVPHADTHN